MFAAWSRARPRDVLLVDRDPPVRREVQHDLADVRRDVGALLGLGRQVDVDALLGERQRRHEDDEQHEQHVDERRDVHVRTGVRDLALDDLVGAEMLVCVCHYLPPLPGLALPFGDEADVLDPRLAERIHRRHHGAVFDLLIGPDEDDLVLRGLEQLVDLVARSPSEIAFAFRYNFLSRRSRSPSAPALRACRGVGRRRQLERRPAATSARRAS